VSLNQLLHTQICTKENKTVYIKPAQVADMICTNVVSDAITVFKNCFEFAYA